MLIFVKFIFSAKRFIENQPIDNKKNKLHKLSKLFLNYLDPEELSS